MPQFVILFHRLPDDSPRRSHWDLMLEDGQILKTWAMPRPPRVGETVAADALPDHRPQYLNYEGPIAGGRGTVERWDCGNFATLARSVGSWVVKLVGKKLQTTMTLTARDENCAVWRIHFAAINEPPEREPRREAVDWPF